MISKSFDSAQSVIYLSRAANYSIVPSSRVLKDTEVRCWYHRSNNFIFRVTAFTTWDSVRETFVWNAVDGGRGGGIFPFLLSLGSMVGCIGAIELPLPSEILMPATWWMGWTSQIISSISKTVSGWCTYETNFCFFFLRWLSTLWPFWKGLRFGENTYEEEFFLQSLQYHYQQKLPPLC